MMDKARIAPTRFVSTPRLEPFTAVLAIKISALVKKELEIEELTEHFSTDHKVVLKYIVNGSRVLQMFVANSKQAIQEYSSVNQWSYILSEDNPVDGASRGMEFNYFSNITRWFQGPAFFWETQSNWERSSAQEANQNSTPDFEWKKQMKVSSVITKEDFISSLQKKISYQVWRTDSLVG